MYPTAIAERAPERPAVIMGETGEAVTFAGSTRGRTASRTSCVDVGLIVGRPRPDTSRPFAPQASLCPFRLEFLPRREAPDSMSGASGRVGSWAGLACAFRSAGWLRCRRCGIERGAGAG